MYELSYFSLVWSGLGSNRLEEGKYNVLAENMTEDWKMLPRLAKNTQFCCHNRGWKISRQSL